jgi:hypothetical protein
MYLLVLARAGLSLLASKVWIDEMDVQSTMLTLSMNVGLRRYEHIARIGILIRLIWFEFVQCPSSSLTGLLKRLLVHFRMKGCFLRS